MGQGEVVLQMTPVENCRVSEANQAIHRQWAYSALHVRMPGIQCPLLIMTYHQLGNDKVQMLATWTTKLWVF